MVSHDPTIIDAYELKSRFAELLKRVQRGEEITITRQGTPIAKLVPLQRVRTYESRKEAIRQMRILAARNWLNGLKIKDLIAEGRR